MSVIVSLLLLSIVSANVQDPYGGPRLIDQTRGPLDGGVGGRKAIYDFFVGVYMKHDENSFKHTYTEDCRFISDAFPHLNYCHQYPAFLVATQISYRNWTMTLTDLQFAKLTDGSSGQFNEEGEEDSSVQDYDGFGIIRYMSSGIWDVDVEKPNGDIVEATKEKFHFQTVASVQLKKIDGKWKISQIQKGFDNMSMSVQLRYPWFYDECLTEVHFPTKVNSPKLSFDCPSGLPKSTCPHAPCHAAI
eukprot:TRINITY_DN12528_c0_g1_i1.p1 TRINITY_DN12528_c0_g1~~TRINITY_DN12528_c0_g1_i1.p1  ORF type:complete len:246 (+),score=34.57 TRINITY_DN12528_c0_g1_i1:88-825(+)